MKYCEASLGRIFVVRLEDGEIVHKEIESFARGKNIKRAALIILGGADKESTLVVGPEEGRAEAIVPLTHTLADVNEVVGTGTIFPDDTGAPVLHMHMACGRKGAAMAGCIRTGVKVWHVMEAIIWELIGTEAKRLPDKETGFKLLIPR